MKTRWAALTLLFGTVLTLAFVPMDSMDRNVALILGGGVVWVCVMALRAKPTDSTQLRWTPSTVGGRTLSWTRMVCAFVAFATVFELFPLTGFLRSSVILGGGIGFIACTILLIRMRDRELG